LRGKLFRPYKRQSRAEGKDEPKNRENESKNREQKYKAKNQNTEKRRKSKGAGQIGVLA
jgi:hypothetical protein